MILNSREVIAESGIAFGTSGARGLVTDFTSEVCEAFTHAFISVMQANYIFDKIAIGIDLRPSSYPMARYCADALKQRGIQPIFYGVLPTPALAYSAMLDNIPAIMVTGSHIPFDRNGLKFYRPDGEISKADEEKISNVASSFEINKASQHSKLDVSGIATNRYIERYETIVQEDVLAGKRIGIYEHSSAGRDIYAKLFEKLGATVISLGRSDEFVPIDTEAVSDVDHEQAKIWSNQHQLDSIFSTDGDGDRPLISDEHGNWLRGDVLGLLCAKLLKIEALAVPINCNTAIETSDLFKIVVRTSIGSPYVIDAFEELTKTYSAVAGFEANGGFILSSSLEVNNKVLKKLPTRDALLPAIVLMTNKLNLSIAELTLTIPNRFTSSGRITNFSKSMSETLISNIIENPGISLKSVGITEECVSIDQTDGCRVFLDNKDIIHLRPSGNAPELRIYSESECSLKAIELVQKITHRISSL